MSITSNSSFEFPLLETARLRLRPHSKQDFANCCALWSDPVVTKHTTRKALSGEEVWTRLLRYAGHWAMLGYGYWVMEEKLTGAFVGEIGFADYKREIVPPLDAPEAGWVLASSAHCKGFATEALTQLLAWGDANLNAERTVCIISPENKASIRVAEKCEYHEVMTLTYHDTPVLLFERFRPHP
jgi:RimJ/RimL family protein N-acetyltransferase